ncbi:sigma D regulator [Halomonas garicola]|uniref:sigma D regulator n=1 Tax=Halomonas garicola TaxID=1690008 RepID=UPI002897E96C|nr:sigma D regulator [Halomonas garicola]
MLDHCNDALERRGGVHDVIDRWLVQRRALLESLIVLQESCDAELSKVDKAHLDTFSERLMDYISAGHFSVYPQLAKEARAFDDHAALALAGKLLERLEMSTELTLAFDDDYSSPVRCRQNLGRLPAWLDRLARGLAERFALEDQLIARLHAVNLPGDGARPAPAYRA